jgi:hypothetical protein
MEINRCHVWPICSCKHFVTIQFLLFNSEITFMALCFFCRFCYSIVKSLPWHFVLSLSWRSIGAMCGQFALVNILSLFSSCYSIVKSLSWHFVSFVVMEINRCHLANLLAGTVFFFCNCYNFLSPIYWAQQLLLFKILYLYFPFSIIS